MKRNNICIIEKKKKKGTGSAFKAVMAEDFLNLGKEIDIQIQEDQKNP